MFLNFLSIEKTIEIHNIKRTISKKLKTRYFELKLSVMTFSIKKYFWNLKSSIYFKTSKYINTNNRW